MKYIEVRTDWSKKLSTLSVLGTMALAPLFAAPEIALAQPPAHAPAHGYYKKNKKDKREKRQERRDRGYDDRDDYYDGDDNYQDYATRVSGVIERDLPGERFVIRADDGRLLQVALSSGYEPAGLSVGDRVELTGRRSGNYFTASSVRFLSDGDTNNDYDTTLQGIVIRNLRGNEFELRADNGRTYLVRTRRGEPIRLTEGDRVEVNGSLNRGVFSADSLRIVRDDDRNSDGSRVNFQGRVVSVESPTRLIVRGDNFRTYTVDSSQALSSSFSTGDRVRVRGTVRRGIVRADSITLRRDDTTSGQSVDFKAVVTKVNRTSDVLTVRGNNGEIYTVRTSNADEFKSGNKVRVVGTVRRGIVIASSVTRR